MRVAVGTPRALGVCRAAARARACSSETYQWPAASREPPSREPPPPKRRQQDIGGPYEWYKWRLTQSKQVAKNTRMLRFSLPPELAPGRRKEMQLPVGAPPGSDPITVTLPDGPATLAISGLPGGVKVRVGALEKSYSPITVPSREGFCDLLVKRYPPHPERGWGLGAALCAMVPPDTIDVRVKPPKPIHGAPYERGRYTHLGLVGCGTGVAPLLQMARTVLEDPLDTTRVTFVASHRSEAYIPMLLEEYEMEAETMQFGGSELGGITDTLRPGQEWESLERSYPTRFRGHTILSQPEGAEPEWGGANDIFTTVQMNPHEHFWSGAVGRVCASCVRSWLPRPGTGGLIVVCGTDGFLDLLCGGHVRVDEPGQAKPRKTQGPLRGLLADAGYAKEEVWKL